MELLFAFEVAEAIRHMKGGGGGEVNASLSERRARRINLFDWIGFIVAVDAFLTRH